MRHANTHVHRMIEANRRQTKLVTIDTQMTLRVLENVAFAKERGQYESADLIAEILLFFKLFYSFFACILIIQMFVLCKIICRSELE